VIVMSDRNRTLLRWGPRMLGIAVALFLAAFAPDVFGEGRNALQTALALLVHLIPSLLGLAAVYAMSTLRRLEWILVIAGPLALVGVLFALSWRYGPPRRPRLE
jgi:hypothetical protein